MELDSLKTMWQEYDQKLEKTLKLNLATLELIQTQKVKSALTPLYWQKAIEIVFHITMLVLVAIFCFYNYDQLPYAISGYMLIVFLSMAFSNCLYQLKTLNSINAKNDVISIQSSLAKIKANSLQYVRLSVLFIPALLSFPVIISKTIIDFKLKSFSSFDIIKQTNGTWWVAQVIAFVILIPLGIWFYRETNYNNMQKKWVTNLIEKASGTRLRRAIEYIKELETLRNGII